MYAATEDATDAATLTATRDATDAATRDATLTATLAATYAATYDATVAPTRDATRDATLDATLAATVAATDAATRAATDAATRDATDDYCFSCQLSEIKRWVRLFAKNDAVFWWRCAQSVWRMWQGGNQWSSWDSYLTFFQDIARLNLPIYAKYKHWRTLAEHSGPRVMHPEFCMISDRPEVLLIDDQNRPHCTTGPFCRWRDGSSLYAIHGVRVPAWVVEHPELITVKKIQDEQNAEVRRIMMERYGLSRYLIDSDAKIIHADEFGTLYRQEVLRDEPLVMVAVINSTAELNGDYKTYFLRVNPELRPLLQDGSMGEPQTLTARNAVASSFGLRGEQYELEVQT